MWSIVLIVFYNQHGVMTTLIAYEVDFLAILINTSKTATTITFLGVPQGWVLRPWNAWDTVSSM